MRFVGLSLVGVPPLPVILYAFCRVEFSWGVPL
jgi:hypothetical protein